MDPEKVEERTTVITVEDTKVIDETKIKFAKVYRPERTKTIQTIDTTGSRRPSISAPKRPEKKRKGDKKNVDITEHLLSAEECAAKYNTHINTKKASDSKGLTTQQAANILAETGLNQLSPPKKRHPILKYIDCVLKLFNLLLILAGILDYILLAINFQENFANTYLGAILIGVALLNAFIEFYQEQKSQALLDSFLNMVPAKCMVIRDGKMQQIDAVNLVIGDVVMVRMGDKVPADLFLFQASDLKVDNSPLTGESDPQERGPNNTQKNVFEAENIIFNGTLAVSGEGYGIVVRTGDSTVLGQIAGLTAGESKEDSPLSKEIATFVKIIASIALVTAAIFFGIGFPVNNNNISLTLNFAISVFVAWVPEGLPATVTILLTISAKRMAARNVLVKDLQGVETLGAITLLATDKTGTLTRNQMTVTYIWSCLSLRNVMDKQTMSEKAIQIPGVREILNISTLNSRAKFDRVDVPVSQRQILGDATETGLVRFAGEQFGDLFDTLPDQYPKVFEIPFNSDNKWAMTIHKMKHANGDLTLYVKGAPERVLKLCDSILTESGSVPLTQEHQNAFQETYSYMAGQGHRVLAFAQVLLDGHEYPADYVFDKSQKNYPMSGMTFVGLASLEDPPKHGVREAIGKCRAAGIKVMMVTGDHPLTAEAIGRKINLMVGETKEMVAKRTGRSVEEVSEDEYNSIVIHGDMIDGLTDDDWDNIFSKDEVIFARTSPKHKLEIVKHAQALRHIVGVTGDGVNDAPALKKADLGIAMNISGSDVSKDAAAMILLDDNFASIIHGIEEGRLIFTNLKKSIMYTITHSMPEVIPNLLYIIVPLPLPLSAILILVIDLGFELFAALTFAWDVPETKEGLMKLPPRKPVTPDSIDRYRRYLHRRQRYVQYDESGEEVRSNVFRRMYNKLHELTTAAYWKEKFEKTDDEVLVDLPLLSWAYLEIGIIEAIGCLTAYFVVLWYNGITPYDAVIMQRGASSPTNYFSNGPIYALDYLTATGKLLNAEAQHRALGQAQSITYWSVMVMQMFNMFACKTRFSMPIGRYMFSNKWTFAGILGGASLATLIVYCPPFNIPFGTEYHLLPLWWLIPVGFGFIIIAYACLRMKIRQRFNPISFNPEIHGLRMHPTIFTVATTESGHRMA
ncbi:hypothetical protein G6F70_003584 [Rhizopus microsporus]|uniref:Cation-transporting P-type ATPase N-terminal domain-containing protein n=1 Tax=Rhizopus microsporus TaxID=58291 RepID=A0A1X0S5X4_RHIZD|nr:hypothetical protein G6F71_002059 [Rhizopus microsporus]KAG1200955.1 hypothetical protein G6F70_003584 [Rhizopus microsporus]KAG1212786.1 hypothetical protein G6F69_003391 [Rhizopus microsporus]KAG1236406.1 hypothetical protein G6F67_002009 [Rhizopus microsporus]KAG1268275.1 hypothetical protein G6F68_001244 [Rhizopus microsporus]